MTTMDNIKYALGIYERNHDKLYPPQLEEFYMSKAISLYNKGLRRADMQKMSILWDCRMVVL